MDMTRSGVNLCSWNSPAPSAGNTGFYISKSVSAKQSRSKPGWRQSCGTDAGMWVHCTRHLSMTPVIWSSASLTHQQAYHKTSSAKQLTNGESGYMKAWSMKAKGH